jgi:hypothetical protein
MTELNEKTKAFKPYFSMNKISAMKSDTPLDFFELLFDEKMVDIIFASG